MTTLRIAALALAVTSVGSLASSAEAKPARPKPKAVASAAVEQSPIVLSKDIKVTGELGQDYTLGLRRATEVAVGESDKGPARSVTESAVGKVVRERSEELEYCWLRVPAAKRTGSSAVLKLMIEASGAVAGADLEGEVPAGVSKCITAAASKWTFPAADEGCEIEHGLSLQDKTVSAL